MTPESRERWIDVLRLAAALAWLALAAAVFHRPFLELSGAEDLAEVGEEVAEKIGLDGLREMVPDTSDREAEDRFISADSKPPGGRLYVNGEDRGILPVMVNISCRQGQSIDLRVELEDFQTWEREVQCPGEETLDVEAVLQR